MYSPHTLKYSVDMLDHIKKIVWLLERLYHCCRGRRYLHIKRKTINPSEHTNKIVLMYPGLQVEHILGQRRFEEIILHGDTDTSYLAPSFAVSALEKHPATVGALSSKPITVTIMKSPEQSWKSFSDMSDFLQGKVTLLYQTKGQIEGLEMRLRHLRKQELDLKEELAACGIQTPPRMDLIPIHRYPEEILYLIFEQYLAVSSHTHIRRLLLVCRRWSRIATDPRLWARVEVHNPWDLFDRIITKSRLPYIKTCIRRSRELPLDVVLHLKALPSADDYVAEVLTSITKKITDAEDPSVRSFLYEVQWESSPMYDTLLMEALDGILGLDNVYTQRWKSLRIILPLSAIGRRIWQRLGRASFPRLMACDVASIPLNWIRDGEISKKFPALDLPVVQSLGLAGAVGSHCLTISPSLFKITSATVQYPYLDVNNTLSNISAVSALTNLRTLKLAFPDSNTVMVPPDNPLRLLLPHLTTLVLFEDCVLLENLEFDFPSLELLQLESFGGYHYKIPKMSPRHIWWGVDNWCSDTGMGEPCIIALSDRMETIRVSKVLRRRALTVVGRLRDEGKLKSLLKVIVEDRRGSYKEDIVIDAEDIRGDNLNNIFGDDSEDEKLSGVGTDIDEDWSSDENGSSQNND